MTHPDRIDASTSAIWQNHIAPPDMPAGFGVRTTYPNNPDGVEVMLEQMLEQWKAGTGEPPHSRPGEDMTVVVEGSMAVQFYTEGQTACDRTAKSGCGVRGKPVISRAGASTTPSILRTAN